MEDTIEVSVKLNEITTSIPFAKMREVLVSWMKFTKIGWLNLYHYARRKNVMIQVTDLIITCLGENNYDNKYVKMKKCDIFKLFKFFKFGSLFYL